MKCKQAQKHLLGSIRPDEPADDVQAHLASCPECRELQRQLLLVEKHVPMLPIPTSISGKASTIERLFILKIEDEYTRQSQRVQRSSIFLSRSSLLRWSAGLAAACVLLAAGLWALQNWPQTPGSIAEKPLLDRLVERDLDLAKAETAEDRLNTLADLADDLHKETRALAKDCARRRSERAGLHVRPGGA